MEPDRAATAAEDHLRALAAGQTGVLESLARMRVGNRERSRLDEETWLLVRLAALVATDASPAAYRAHLDAGGGGGLPAGRVLGALVAAAPVVGSVRVLSAASKLALAGLLPTQDRRIIQSG